MKFLKMLGRFFATVVLLCATLPFVLYACVLVFKLTGMLGDGPMFGDMATPSYTETLITLAVSGALIAGCLALRKKLAPAAPPAAPAP